MKGGGGGFFFQIQMTEKGLDFNDMYGRAFGEIWGK